MAACLLLDVLSCTNPASGAPHGLCAEHRAQMPPEVQGSRTTATQVASWYYAWVLCGIGPQHGDPKARRALVAQQWAPLFQKLDMVRPPRT